MLTSEVNYSRCPLKKRPFYAMNHENNNEIDDTQNSFVEQNEPEDLSIKSKRFATSRSSSPQSEKRCSSVESTINVEDDDDDEIDAKSNRSIDESAKVSKEDAIKSPEYLYKNWPCPLTPPLHFGTPNDTETQFLAPVCPTRFDSPFAYVKDDLLFKPQLPLYPPSYILPPTNFNNNVIKGDPFINPKYFTPYRVDQNVSTPKTSSVHRPLFGAFPLSPASSQASFNSYEESPRRSESPLSTHSSTSEQPSSSTSSSSPTKLTPPKSNYSVFRDVTAMSTGAVIDKPKSKSESRKSLKSAHYQCTDCSKSYSTYSGLSKHQQFHCPAIEGNHAKKVFSCKNCDKTYTSLGALKMHIRTHTLPCKCEICGKAFSRPWLLQGHIRTHTGEKPFSCQHCHRAFADRSNLRAHLQTHSEIKKYSCTTCSKTFSRMSLLTKHIEVGCPGLEITHKLSLY